MKKIFLTAACFLIAICVLHAAPSLQLQKLFKETFPQAENVHWYEDANGCSVSFDQAQISNRINYDKDENFISATRYYGADNLPINIMMRLSKKYKDRNIFGVTEYTNADGITYHIKLDDAKKWYTVKATPEGDMQLEESFKKQTDN